MSKELRTNRLLLTLMAALVIVFSMFGPVTATEEAVTRTNPTLKYCKNNEVGLKIDDEGECVKSVQTFLKFAVWGRNYAPLCPIYAPRIHGQLAITRVFNDQTRRYLKCYQEWQGISITGKANNTTFAKMLKTCLNDSAYKGIPAGDNTVKNFKDYWFCNPDALSVYLTFDDGPVVTWTDAVLDILEEKGVKATFYVNGWKVDKYPEIVQDTWTRGQSVQNHTYGHPNLTSLSDSSVRWQIEQGAISINNAIGVWSTCLRPPYGATSTRVNNISAEFGQEVIIWTKNSVDYSLQTSSGIYSQSKYWGAGDVVLGHDTWGMIWDNVLGQIIDDIRNKGLEFDSMCTNPTERPW